MDFSNRGVHHVEKDGILQVDPLRMKDVVQDVPLTDQRRIIRNRNDYLSWMQNHFAAAVVPAHSDSPEAREEELTDATGSQRETAQTQKARTP